jgi:predicted GNAT superfamily acetyltransferase
LDDTSRLAGCSLKIELREAKRVAFMLVFRSGISHIDPNYLWFSARLTDFLYIDRIIVGAAARGKGIGTLLYNDLFASARALNVSRVTCEIDCDPPNEVSTKFHSRFGFHEIGRHKVDGGKKTVSLQEALVLHISSG